jgi:hypothetical protein
VGACQKRSKSLSSKRCSEKFDCGCTRHIGRSPQRKAEGVDDPQSAGA